MTTLQLAGAVFALLATATTVVGGLFGVAVFLWRTARAVTAMQINQRMMAKSLRRLRGVPERLSAVEGVVGIKRPRKQRVR